MKFSEIEGLSVTSVVDNYYDALRKDPPCGKRFRTEPSSSIYAEHGLSFYIEVTKRGISHNILFDFAVDGTLLLRNMRILKIDPKKVEVLVLSHGHFDHYGGLKHFLREIKDEPLTRPFYVGIPLFTRRFSKRSGSEELTDLGELKREEIEKERKIEILESEEPREIFEGCYLTGRIPMVTDYEGLPENLFVEREGILRQDNFEEEQALFFIHKKGLIVLSGCGHRGIGNTLHHIKNLTGIDKIYALIGGFHLINASSERILRTAEEIKSFSPRYVIPCHCTGLESLFFFSDFFENALIINTVGTKYNFR